MKINKVSERRKKQVKVYKKIIPDYEISQCFFCGQLLGREAEKHHLLGKIENKLTDEKYIVCVHHSCHMQYHEKSCKDIAWFKEYAGRLRKDSSMKEVFLKEYRKMIKSNFEF